MIGNVLRAHYDGAQILLDEPASIRPNAQLLITVLPEADEGLEAERADFFRMAAASLERAYGPNEPEYTLDDLIKVNPNYERR